MPSALRKRIPLISLMLVAVFEVTVVLGGSTAAGAQTRVPRLDGLPVWTGPLPARPHGGMFAAAQRVLRPFRVPAHLSPAAWIRFVNGPARARLQEDARDVATIRALTTELDLRPDAERIAAVREEARRMGMIGMLGGPAPTPNRAFAAILLTVALDAQRTHALAVDEADPAHEMNVAAGIGVAEHARAARATGAAAQTCANEARAARGAIGAWAERCAAIAAEMERLGGRAE